MSEESEDDSSKTEEPSQKKLDEAKKRGQMVSSRELNHFFMLLVLTFFVTSWGQHMGISALDKLAPYITQPDQFEVSPAGFKDTMREAFLTMAGLLAIPFLLTFVGALAPSVVQKKWVFSAESIKPKWNKLSPMAGFKRIFGMKALVEFLKSLAKISVVGLVAYMVARPYQDQFSGLVRTHKTSSLEFSELVISKMLIAVCIFLFLLSIFDYFYQRIMFMKSMRMSKQELKDEYKQQEGDPHIKQKLKAIRREKARQRMMANVPKADVIITNPTHYAVALQYDPATMPAPKLLAKGTDEVAARIREVAEKHKIILVRNPPLARAIYATTDIDEAIPVEHYQAVAKVIGYVYKLKGKTPIKPPASKMGSSKPTLTPKKK